ncbi:hypothetical protein [Streptomyces sp. RKND-216]|uniref:hypothetical protein n=1 Tax=Streptomyces sp. RKND-216 TaxID=2562581 RepID=UPI001B34AC4F|nr:hypothetical protein [Streptomyces sp. RKND-216]
MKPHAEIDEVWPRDGRIRLVGSVHGREPGGDGWQLVLALRGHEKYRLRYDVRLDGTAFDASVPVDDLALDGLHKAVWDLHLSPSGDDEETLTVGRHLDDIAGKRKIFVFPGQSAQDEDGTVVRPVYSNADDLTVECVPGDLPLSPDELPFERTEWMVR